MQQSSISNPNYLRSIFHLIIGIMQILKMHNDKTPLTSFTADPVLISQTKRTCTRDELGENSTGVVCLPLSQKRLIKERNVHPYQCCIPKVAKSNKSNGIAVMRGMCYTRGDVGSSVLLGRGKSRAGDYLLNLI